MISKGSGRSIEATDRRQPSMSSTPRTRTTRHSDNLRHLRGRMRTKRHRVNGFFLERVTREKGFVVALEQHRCVWNKAGAGHADSGSRAREQVRVLAQKKIEFSESAMTIAAITVTRPGRMKLWLRRYFPTLVVPVESKETAANRVPYVGRTKTLLAAG